VHGFLKIMPRIADHFVQAKVRHFDFEQKDQALEWLATGRWGKAYARGNRRTESLLARVLKLLRRLAGMIDQPDDAGADIGRRFLHVLGRVRPRAIPRAPAEPRSAACGAFP
jgi:hypothetical protein